jgi:hypothetical protein
MAEVNLSDGQLSDGIAPADRLARQTWPAWKIALAYAVLFGVAVGSIWMIDSHVLLATESKDPATAHQR